MQSAEIGKLAEALAKAQGEMEAAKKSSDNPYFKSKYADLHSIIMAAKGPLSSNGLAVVQTMADCEDGATVKIVTTLMHSSGQWINGEITLRPVKADPQGVGSAITYGRRYGYQAIVGLSAEDDDGNAASRPAPKTITPEQAASITKEQIDEIETAIVDAAADRAKFLAWVKADSVEALTRGQYAKGIVALREAARKRVAQREPGQEG